MEWAEITVVTSAEAVEAVSNRFQELGAQGTVISDPEPVLGQTSGEVRVSAYFPVDGRLEQRVQEIREFVTGLGQYGLAPGPGRVEVRRVEDEDWAEAWKSYYRPIRVGRRILVRPSWEEAPAEGVVIELDPGMAFGTGTHPTTALCLEVLEEVLRQGEAVWDLGTGSGILAIGAARLGAGRVEAFDVDPVAVQAARRNAARNGVEDVVSVHERDVAAAGENLPQELSHAPDVIVVNIIAEVIVRLAPRLAAWLAPGGRAVCSGIISARREEVAKALERAGLAVKQVREREGWVCLVAEKSARAVVPEQ